MRSIVLFFAIVLSLGCSPAFSAQSDPSGALITDLSGNGLKARFQDTSWDPALGEILPPRTNVEVPPEGTVNLVHLETNEAAEIIGPASFSVGIAGFLGLQDGLARRIEGLTAKLDLGKNSMAELCAISSDHISSGAIESKKEKGLPAKSEEPPDLKNLERALEEVSGEDRGGDLDFGTGGLGLSGIGKGGGGSGHSIGLGDIGISGSGSGGGGMGSAPGIGSYGTRGSGRGQGYGSSGEKSSKVSERGTSSPPAAPSPQPVPPAQAASTEPVEWSVALAIPAELIDRSRLWKDRIFLTLLQESAPRQLVPARKISVGNETDWFLFSFKASVRDGDLPIFIHGRPRPEGPLKCLVSSAFPTGPRLLAALRLAQSGKPWQAAALVIELNELGKLPDKSAVFYLRQFSQTARGSGVQE